MEAIADIYKCAALCRAFENECALRIISKEITIPVYLSTGQEYIPATISAWAKTNISPDRQIFIQHRGHSTYLSFGGSMDKLILELLGNRKGCAGGMGGSASIHSVEANIYGHDGLMGTQAPIAVGMCYANRKPTICFAGDAAAEEDYFLAALGWAATKDLPILFVVEDNGLSILTKTEVRRSWRIIDVARGFGLTALHVSDHPRELFLNIPKKWPALLNVHTNRLHWHAGAGVDNPDIFDRHKEIGNTFFSSDYQQQVKYNAIKTVRQSWLRATN